MIKYPRQIIGKYSFWSLLLYAVLLGCIEKKELPDNSSDITKGIYEKSVTFYKNDKGFWEAELLDKHFVVQIPAGEFQMGSDQGEAKELPIHDVVLDEYWMSKYSVTVAQFRKFVEETGYVTDAEKGEGCWIEEGGRIRYDVSWRNPNFVQGADHPAICVSWNDATAYTEWLSKKTGLTIQLPTEVQWEKSARGNDKRLWPWGNELPDGTQANFAESQYLERFGDFGRNPSPNMNDEYPQTSPVDAFPKGQSPYGVYDMAGNVIDWLYDWFDASYYSNSPTQNPIGPYHNPIRRKFETERGWGDNLQRSIRGGAWTDASGELSLEEGGHSVRADMREQTDQHSSDDHLGFRFVIVEGHRYAPYRETLFSSAQAAVMESVGDAQITIDYDRLLTDDDKPAFGTLVPYGKPWSPGQDAATVLSVDNPIQIHGKTINPGSYNLYLIPQQIDADMKPGSHMKWKVIFTQPATHQQKEFEPGQEVLRFETRAQLEDNSKQHMEFFFDENENGRIIRFLYGFVEVHIPISEGSFSKSEESKAMVMNAMGETEIQVHYYRTVAAEREIYGTVVPYNEPWPGAELPTTIEFGEDVVFQDKALPKGKYGLSIIPTKGKFWKLILTETALNEETEDFETSEIFNEDIEVSLSESGANRLEYFFDYSGANERNLALTWDKATLQFNIKKN
ncbi:SUMF1/EgtB/PvdO family nonheme iron enzyme [Ulvibacterium sp.]|uniref:SUMF1/EgtB/PvdO family nonheme iron enzyme n=1 Tax=Ulvibacterium sp. TaxID=2665914 RepID=UPI002619FF47|nr:SUMF1/EgtB/PvdO family nonheme iron enzyme [Ulvibacterium sp.]